jgi:hypothetical protein
MYPKLLSPVEVEIRLLAIRDFIWTLMRNEVEFLVTIYFFV